MDDDLFEDFNQKDDTDNPYAMTDNQFTDNETNNPYAVIDEQMKENEMEEEKHNYEPVSSTSQPPKQYQPPQQYHPEPQKYHPEPPQHYSEPPQYHSESQYQPPQYQPPQYQPEYEDEENEIYDKERFYLDSERLENIHNMPDPLSLLEERRPGNDRRNFLPKDMDNKIKICSNVVFIGNLPTDIDEETIKNIFKPVCEAKRLVLFKAKHHCFVTLYKRKDAVELFYFMSQIKEPKYLVSWGKEYWMKSEIWNEREGICTLPVEKVPPIVIVNFDNTYIGKEDIGKVYGKEYEQSSFNGQDY